MKSKGQLFWNRLWKEGEVVILSHLFPRKVTRTLTFAGMRKPQSTTYLIQKQTTKLEGIEKSWPPCRSFACCWWLDWALFQRSESGIFCRHWRWNGARPTWQLHWPWPLSVRRKLWRGKDRFFFFKNDDLDDFLANYKMHCYFIAKYFCCHEAIPKFPHKQHFTPFDKGSSFWRVVFSLLNSLFSVSFV